MTHIISIADQLREQRIRSYLARMENEETTHERVRLWNLAKGEIVAMSPEMVRKMEAERGLTKDGLRG